MKVIIAGSRTIPQEPVHEYLQQYDWKGNLEEIVSGKARGVDTWGELWAVQNLVPVAEFPANWDRDGKAAGFLRNIEMANYADRLIAFWDGQSRGTKHMIDTMLKYKKPVVVEIIETAISES